MDVTAKSGAAESCSHPRRTRPYVSVRRCTRDRQAHILRYAKLLMATGRSPHSASLGAQAAGLARIDVGKAPRAAVPQQHATSARVGGRYLAGSPWSTAASNDRRRRRHGLCHRPSERAEMPPLACGAMLRQRPLERAADGWRQQRHPLTMSHVFRNCPVNPSLLRGEQISV